MNILRSRLALLCVLAFSMLVLFDVRPASAVPVFARKYQTSCMTCHEMMPRLNAFGEAFRLNGFRWPSGAQPAHEQEPVPLGAEAYKKEFPKAVWPTDIPGSLPLALRTLGMFRGASRAERETEWEWELQTAGTLGEKISFFGHANYVGNSGPSSSTTNKLSLAGFTNFHDLFSRPHLLNLQLGIVAFEESDFFHYRNHATASLLPAPARTFGSNDVIPYPTGFAKANLFKLKRGPGVMLWGFTPRSAYSVGYRLGDQDGGGSDMNVLFGQWAYKIGGMDYNGKTTQHFDQGYEENSLSFGVMGDVGNVPVRATAAAPLKTDSFWRGGGDIRLKRGAWTGRAGVLRGNNSNPYATLAIGAVRYSTYFLQTDYHVLPWLLPEIRYEADRFRVPSTVNVGQPNRSRFVPSISALYGANARFTLWTESYTKKRTNAAAQELDTSRIGLQFDVAF